MTSGAYASSSSSSSSSSSRPAQASWHGVADLSCDLLLSDMKTHENVSWQVFACVATTEMPDHVVIRTLSVACVASNHSGRGVVIALNRFLRRLNTHLKFKGPAHGYFA
eukprot:3576371-Amphidinium_carterae.1